ncbi:UNKNOWN [Stylonychia lemnae]|uniref:Cadg domain containing protein n=1 Tax=Stylonychia lemnae TaxID=5949 RepID=A0A078AWL1_STYLE|nr:UNKNOWN [Stylonychia lemnae]|eukprot:CDW85193.1 UNKNOWN [Stylonychia lemnae]
MCFKNYTSSDTKHLNFVIGNAITDYTSLQSFDVKDDELAVIFFVLTESRPYIMLYDVKKSQQKWVRYKDSNSDNFEAISFLTKQSQIVVLDSKNVLIYIDKVTGKIDLQYQLKYTQQYPQRMILDKNDVGYIACNGDNLKWTILYVFQQIPDKNLTKWEIDNPISCTAAQYFSKYRNGILRINTNNVPNTEMFIQKNEVIDQGSDRNLIIQGLYGEGDLIIGIMNNPDSGSGTKIGVTVLNTTTNDFKLYYQESFGYTYQEVKASLIVNKTIVKFFLSTFNTPSSEKFQWPISSQIISVYPEVDLAIDNINPYIRIQERNYDIIQPSDIDTITKGTFKNAYNNKKPCQISPIQYGQGFEIIAPYSLNDTVICYADLPCQVTMGQYKVELNCSNLGQGIEINLFESSNNDLWFHEQKSYSEKGLITYLNITFNSSQYGLFKRYLNMVYLLSQNDLIISTKFQLTFKVHWPCELAKVQWDGDQNVIQDGRYSQSLANFNDWVLFKDNTYPYISINSSYSLSSTKYIAYIQAINYNLTSNTLINSTYRLLYILFDPIREINSPPYFTSYVPKLITAPNQVNQYKISEIRDNQFDNFTLQIDIGIAFSFVSLKDGYLLISPTENDSGNYRIIFKLKQTNYPYISRIYNLDIFVEEFASIESQVNSPRIFQMTNSARIISINATGYAVVRFKDKLEKPKYFTDIDYRRIKIEIYYEIQQESELIDYKMISISRDTITFKLLFKDIYKISKYQEQDTISIRFLDISQTLQHLWSAINSFQILSHLPMIAINSPANVQIFYLYVLTLATFNVLPLHSVYSDILQLNDEIDQPMNDYFSQYGYQSMNVIMNLGTIFLITLANLSIIFLAFLLKLLAKICKRVGLILSTCIMILIFLFPMLILLLMVTNYDHLQDPDLISKYGSFYEQIRTERLSSTLYVFSFIVRRFLFCFTIVLLRDHPIYQIYILMYSSLFILVYVINYMPFKSKFDNYIEILNEFSVLASFYVMMCYTDFLADDMEIKMNLGWATKVYRIIRRAVHKLNIRFKQFMLRREKAKLYQLRQFSKILDFAGYSNSIEDMSFDQSRTWSRIKLVQPISLDFPTQKHFEKPGQVDIYSKKQAAKDFKHLF